MNACERKMDEQTDTNMPEEINRLVKTRWIVGNQFSTQSREEQKISKNETVSPGGWYEGHYKITSNPQ